MSVTVTHVLIGLNVAAWLLNIVSGVDPLSPTPQDLFDWGASHVLANAEQPWRLLSSTFLHVGLLHLAVNMQALWVAGPIADAMLGRWQFLMIYLCAGGFGGLGCRIWNDGGDCGRRLSPRRPITSRGRRVPQTPSLVVCGHQSVDRISASRRQ